MGADAAYTSINQIPALFKQYSLGPINLDFGGGRFNTGTSFLEEHGIESLVYDPYNRSAEHNLLIMKSARSTGVDTITVANVLNVIKDKSERLFALRYVKTISEFNNKNSNIIIQIYEGNKSGKPSEKTVQNNFKTESYIPEVELVFNNFEIKQEGKFLIVW